MSRDLCNDAMLIEVAAMALHKASGATWDWSALRCESLRHRRRVEAHAVLAAVEPLIRASVTIDEVLARTAHVLELRLDLEDDEPGVTPS